MPRNKGSQPGQTRGKRVRVQFRSGFDSAQYDPAHWPADSLRWSIETPPHPSDILAWKLAD